MLQIIKRSHTILTEQYHMVCSCSELKEDKWLKHVIGL